ncbi:MAG: hypothetical protein AAFP87_18700 [Pseudomonadota bacterium]
MDRRRQRSRAVAAGAAISAVALCAAWAPAFGQEGGGGPLFTFGVSTTLTSSDNADLDVVSAGDTTQLETTLSFGFETVTRTQALRFSFSDTLRSGSGPDAENDLRGPNVALSYEREVADARFDLSARQSTRDVDSALSQEELENLDTADALAVDSGTLTNRVLSFGMETGRQGPVGTELSLSQTRRDYSNTTDPDLEDSRTDSASAAVVLRPDDATEVRLSYGITEFTREDAVGTERTTRTFGINARRQLDPTTLITAGLGWTEITEDQTAIPLSLPDETGLTALFGYERDLQSGTVSARLSRGITSAGHRTDLTATRVFELPDGSVEITLGVAKPEARNAQPTGRVAYVRERADQSFGFALSSNIAVNSDRQVQRNTTADVSYNMQLTERDSFGLDLDFAKTSDVDGSGVTERTRSSATASYQRTLTPDWTLAAGLTHRRSRREGEGTARSNAAFVTLGREFSWRP